MCREFVVGIFKLIFNDLPGETGQKSQEIPRDKF